MAIVVSVFTIALAVFALVDLFTTDDLKVRHLPKIGWVVLIVILPLIGSLVWLIAGKERTLPTLATPHTEAPRPKTPTSTEQELAALEREIERAEKAEKIRKLEEEVKRRKGTSQA
jgi:hypothetical protein